MRETQRGFRGHVHRATPRDVVQDDRQFHRTRDGAEMLIQTLLRRLVVVRHHAHEAVDAELRHIACEVDRIRRAVIADVGDNRDAAIDCSDHGFEQLDLVRIEHSGRFTRGAVDDKGVGAALYQTVSKLLSTIEIEIEIVLHGRDHGRDHAAETRISHRWHLSVQARFDTMHLNRIMQLRHIMPRHPEGRREVIKLSRSRNNCCRQGGNSRHKRQRASFAYCYSMKFSRPTIRPRRSPTLRMPSSTPGIYEVRSHESWRMVRVWPMEPNTTSWLAT